MRRLGVAVVLLGLALVVAVGPAWSGFSTSSSLSGGVAAGADRAGRDGPAVAEVAPVAAVAAGVGGRSAASFTGSEPVSFEENAGQVDPQVRFVSRAADHTMFLTGTEAVWSLPTATDRQVVRMGLVGANPAPQVSGVDRLAATSSYLSGPDPAGWHRSVPSYAGVRYEQVYPGIDQVFHGRTGQVEYDFEVAAGADPAGIGVRFGPATGLALEDGELVITTAAGVLRQGRPTLYQQVDGRRTLVPGGFVLGGPQQVGFWVGGYDRSRPLVIDPVVVYSTFLGGGRGDGADQGEAIAVDPAGNVYVTGYANSDDFPPSAGAFQPAPGAYVVAYVTKFSPSGTRIYSTFLGSGDDPTNDRDNSQGYGIAVDPQGNVYVAGNTLSQTFPTTPDAYQVSSSDGGAFLSELNPDGSALIYSTYLGTARATKANAVALGPSGRVYLAGTAAVSALPPTAAAFQPASGGGQDAFVAVLDPQQPRESGLVYSTFLGGGSFDYGLGIAVGPSGRAYVSGSTSSPDFPVTSGAVQGRLNGSSDAFVAVVDPAASGAAGLVAGTFLGGSDFESGNDIAMDRDRTGAVIVTGFTGSVDFPTKNASQPTFGGGLADAFVAKLAPDLSAMTYATYLGGVSLEGDGVGSGGVAVDAAGNAYVTGDTASPNFPVKNAVQPSLALPCPGPATFCTDAFITKLSPAGALEFSTFLGGHDPDRGTGIAVDAAGLNVYLVGTTFASDFPTKNPSQPRNNGGGDAFVTRILDVPLPTLSALSERRGPATGGQTLPGRVSRTSKGVLMR